MLKSRLNDGKGVPSHFFHHLDSDTDNDGAHHGNQHSPLHPAKDESRVLGIPEINSSNHTHDWWMELWNKDDWETRILSPSFSGGAKKISLVRLHDTDSIQQAAATSLLGTSKISRETNGHGDTRRRTQGTTTRVSFSSREYVNVAWNNTDAPNVSIWNGNTTPNHKNHKKDTNDNANISFDLYLNWASTRNPDGVNLCHKAHDQGACGACWAFAATGSLEASAARRIAYSAYQQSVQHSKRSSMNTNTNIGHSLRRKRRNRQRKYKDDYERIDEKTFETAVAVAQGAEREAIRVANLSVQELVDCDSYGDQGCTGGNPLLAFYFIHLHGLTLSRLYPYAGMEHACRWNLVQEPVATVESWGILTPNHEDNMQSVLRNIGPIAVGVNGADSAFLSYSGGIFESAECNQQANHALLIVGYGQEQDANGTMVRYWIARNSWGLGWGENGMVRIKRGSGKKGEEGVCGIAKSPSVALGGVLLPASGIASTNVMTDIDNSSWKQTQRIETSLAYNHCESIGMGHVRLCNRVQGFCESYHAFIYGLFSLTLVGALVVLPLTRGCRKQRRERRHQAEAARTRGRDENTNMQGASGEMSPLLRLGQTDESYGSGKV